MARYIDADELLAKIENSTSDTWGKGLGRSWWAHSVMLKDNFVKLIKEAPTADVVPKSEDGAECPTCHGTGKIGTTDWLTKNISKKQLAKEKAEAIAEHELHIKQDYAREIFEDIWASIATHAFTAKSEDYADGAYDTIEWVDSKIAEVEKKYTERSE